MNMKRIVVIGNGRFVVDCLNVMSRVVDARVELVISDPKIQTMGGLVQRYCEEHNITHLETAKINSEETLNLVKSAQPDYLFSIFNLRIIKRPLLAIPKQGAINFHNGPLPKYRGVNIYSWVIINGEKEHGVTWHYIDEGIDSGDIIGQKMFAVADDETPFTLARKSLQAGVVLWKEIFESLIHGRIIPTPQDHTQATYYSLKDTPNGGRVDFGWSFERLERFVRGLNFAPIENTFVYPNTAYDGQVFYLQKISRSSDLLPEVEAGQVVSVDDGVLGVRIADAVVGLTELLDSEKRPIAVDELVQGYGIQAGDRLG